MDEGFIYFKKVRMSEFEPTLQPTIHSVTLDDLEGYRAVQARGWIDTYPSDAAGVSLDWVQARAEGWMTPEALADSRERLALILTDAGRQPLYVAKVREAVVGMIHVTNLETSGQRLEALYVDKEYRGQGVAQQLVDQAFLSFDLTQPITLEAASYNERAIRFYQKNGFEIRPGSEHLYKDVMPSITMIKPGEKL